MVLNSVVIENLLKDRQSEKYLQVEKVIEKVEQDPNASFIKKSLADAYRLQQNERIDEAREKWRVIADFAKRKDEDLAKRAGVSIGYLLPERESALTPQDSKSNLKPYDAETRMYRGLGKYTGEGIVIGTILQYFNNLKFNDFSTALEYRIGSGQYRADVVLLTEKNQLAAIVECRRMGNISTHAKNQLKGHLTRCEAKFGIFAADTIPSKWTFIEKLEGEITEISLVEFETGVLSKSI